ncbi:MAG: VCBS repeat-containing protein [Planctomycetota bacterium]
MRIPSRFLILAAILFGAVALTGCLGPLYGVYMAVESAKKNDPAADLAPNAVLGTVADTTDTTVNIPVTVSDSEGDNADLIFEYSVLAGPWAACTGLSCAGAGAVAGNRVEGLNTSAGGNAVTVAWDAAVDLGAGATSEVRVRVSASGSGGSTAWRESNAFRAGNDLPTIVLSWPFGQTFQKTGFIRFAITDTTADLCAIEYEFEDPLDPGTWLDMTLATGTTSSLESAADGTVTHDIVWNCQADLSNKDYTGVGVRLRAIDISGQPGGWTTATVDVRNNDAPVGLIVSVGGVSSDRGGLINLVYVVADAQTDSVDVQIRWSSTGGSDWAGGDWDAKWGTCSEFPMPQSEGRTGLSAAAAGEGHVFVWDSLKDLGVDRALAPVFLGIRAVDAQGAAGTPQYQFLFVNNIPPLPAKTTFPLEQRPVGAAAGDFRFSGSSRDTGLTDLAVGSDDGSARIYLYTQSTLGLVEDQYQNYQLDTSGSTFKGPMGNLARARFSDGVHDDLLMWPDNGATEFGYAPVQLSGVGGTPAGFGDPAVPLVVNKVTVEAQTQPTVDYAMDKAVWIDASHDAFGDLIWGENFMWNGSRIAALWGGGGGSFNPVSPAMIYPSAVADFAVGDFIPDAANLEDIVFVDGYSPCVHAIEQVAPKTFVYRGSTDASSIGMTNLPGLFVRLADLDADGQKDDIVVGHSYTDTGPNICGFSIWAYNGAPFQPWLAVHGDKPSIYSWNPCYNQALEPHADYGGAMLLDMVVADIPGSPAGDDVIMVTRAMTHAYPRVQAYLNQISGQIFMPNAYWDFVYMGPPNGLPTVDIFNFNQISSVRALAESITVGGPLHLILTHARAGRLDIRCQPMDNLFPGSWSPAVETFNLTAPDLEYRPEPFDEDADNNLDLLYGRHVLKGDGWGSFFAGQKVTDNPGMLTGTLPVPRWGQSANAGDGSLAVIGWRRGANAVAYERVNGAYFPIGILLHEVVAGSFDPSNDAREDVLTITTESAGNVKWYRAAAGQPHFSAADATTWTCPKPAKGAMAADLIGLGDGISDVFIPTSQIGTGAKNAYVLRGTGTGLAAASVEIALDENGRTIAFAAGQFTRTDPVGSLDLAMVTYDPDANSSSVWALTHDAAGELATGTPTLLHAIPSTKVLLAAAGDFTGDGAEDLAIGTDSGFLVLYRQGIGGLNAPLPADIVPLGAGMVSAFPVDWNHDNRTDLVLGSPKSDFSAARNVLLLQKTGGGFFDPLIFDVEAEMGVFHAADWNNDGLGDFVAVPRYRYNQRDSVPVFTQVPFAHSLPPDLINLPGGYAIMRTMDANADGRDDVVGLFSEVFNEGMTVVTYPQNLGGGLEPPRVNVASVPLGPIAGFFDTDADGNDEYIVRSATVFGSPEPLLHAFPVDPLADPPGIVDAPVVSDRLANDGTNESPVDPTTGDFDSDGMPEIAEVVTDSTGSVALGTLDIDGDGTLASLAASSNTLNSTQNAHQRKPAVGHLSGSAGADMVMRVERGTIRIFSDYVDPSLANDGFATEQDIVPAAADNLSDVFVMDVDGDGREDLLAVELGTGANTGDLYVWLQDGGGGFSANDPSFTLGFPPPPGLVWPPSSELRKVAWLRLDADGDGLEDAVALVDDTNNTGGGFLVSYLRDPDDANGLVQGPVVRFPKQFYAGVTLDYDGDGNRDIAALSDSVGNNMGVFLWRAGGFQPPMIATGVRDSIAVGDFNSDGRDDIGVVVNTSGLRVYYSRPLSNIVSRTAAAAGTAIGDRMFALVFNVAPAAPVTLGLYSTPPDYAPAAGSTADEYRAGSAQWHMHPYDAAFAPAVNAWIGIPVLAGLDNGLVADLQGDGYVFGLYRSDGADGVPVLVAAEGDGLTFNQDLVRFETAPGRIVQGGIYQVFARKP